MAREAQLRTVAQDDDRVAGEPGLDLRDAVDVYDHGAMNPDEARRVEAMFRIAELHPQPVLLTSHVKPDVVPRRVHVVDVIEGDEDTVAASRDENSRWEPCCTDRRPVFGRGLNRGER